MLASTLSVLFAVVSVASATAVPKKAAPAKYNRQFKAEISSYGRSDFASCGQATLTIHGSKNIRPLTLVLVDPNTIAHDTYNNPKTTVTTLNTMKGENPWSIQEVTAKDGHPFRITLDVPNKYGFDVYAYYPDGTGQFLVSGAKRVGPISPRTSQCIKKCTKDQYSTYNTCFSCKSKFGTEVLTCDFDGAKTCKAPYSMDDGACVNDN